MTIEKKNYKNTVNLPKTDFPMKANLPQTEPEKVKAWEGEDLYAKIRAKSANKPKYVLHDGPPYANGHIHAGHALNKILKDIIVKYKTMRGFDAHYVPGWDCHGMPIEHAIFKEMGKRKEDVNRLEFRKKARQYAEKFIKIQREEFKRLGVFGDWENPYLTMSHDYQAGIARSFLKLLKDGYIEQRLKPVPWCYDCETALADAELEYEDKTSSAIYVAFDLDLNSNALNNKKLKELAGNQTLSVLIWTTTPWTLPANVAIALNPTLNYVVFEVGPRKFIAAENLLLTLKSKFGLNDAKVIETLPGKFFEGLQVRRPFGNEISVGILADYVSSTDGTGIVHIAPGHGEEDYEAGLRYQLPVLSPVDEKGKFTSAFKECEGAHVQKANKKIIELLREKQILLYEEAHAHSYPHCWRCKNPIIFRATKQWFLKVDHENLRAQLKEAINSKIRFVPDWGKNRIGSMMEVRPDWCLSRQRLWGVPIPVIHCTNCGKIFNRETEQNIEKLFLEKSADVWFEKDASEFFDGGKIPACCSTQKIKKEEDIIDVWFDSGVSHQSVLKASRFSLQYPADLYLEGSDQHRGWFQSSLISSMALEKKSPFKSVLTHGFVVDGEGKKMSKSAGNVVSPQDVMKQYGADILRLWVASCDYSQDIRLSNEILTRLADAYRKIRNTFRFLLANLNGFDPTKDLIPFEKMDPIDQFVLAKAEQVYKQIETAYEKFDFLVCFQVAYDFCNLQLSSYYLDVVKDRLYTSAPQAAGRKSAQNAIYQIVRNLSRVLAPIMPFTTYDVWKMIPGSESAPSVHEVDWPELSKLDLTPILKDWEVIQSVHKSVLLELEAKRVAGEIAASLDARVDISLKDARVLEVLKQCESNLKFYYIVSQLSLKLNEAQTEAVSVSVSKADGTKCVRCWNYSIQVGRSDEHPELCERCVEAVKFF